MAKKNTDSPDTKSTVPHPPAQPLEVTRKVVAPPMLPTIYANGFQLAMGPQDIRLILMETIPVSPTEVIDKQLLVVIMTAETLGLLAGSLQGFATEYEKKFGKIREIAASRELTTVIASAAPKVPTEQK